MTAGGGAKARPALDKDDQVTAGQSFRLSHREGRLQAPQASGHQDPAAQSISDVRLRAKGKGGSGPPHQAMPLTARPQGTTALPRLCASLYTREGICEHSCVFTCVSLSTRAYKVAQGFVGEKQPLRERHSLASWRMFQNTKKLPWGYCDLPPALSWPRLSTQLNSCSFHPGASLSRHGKGQ